MEKTKIQTATHSFVVHYPEAIEFANKQLSILWLPEEIHLEKDIQDIRVNMTEAEQHGVITVLKLFTLYELFAGQEYWGGRVMQEFPRPEISRMAATFSMFELAIHQPFYAKINELLGLSTDEFYSEWKRDDVLMQRMATIGETVSSKDPTLSLAVFSMVEGVVLYSSFAFLKHFQSQGKNKLMNLVRGINFSVRDENLHSMAGAWLFKQMKAEGHAVDEARILDFVRLLREQEHYIVDKIFEHGHIDGVTPVQLKHFVDSRINLCLKHLDIDFRYEVTYNPIKDWFYNGVNNFSFNDFFTGVGNQYQRNWDEKGFEWNTSN